MTMIYLPTMMDVTENPPVRSEEIFSLIGNILINTMFDRTPISSGMGFDAIITIGIALGVIIYLVYRRLFCSWQR